MIDFCVFSNIILLSFVAGLGTSLGGGVLAVFHNPGRKSFGFSMGITAGVKISLSFMELISKAWEMKGFCTTTIGFTLGAGCMFLLDFFIPHIRFGEVELHSENEDTDCNHFTHHGRGHRHSGLLFAAAGRGEVMCASWKATVLTPAG